LLIWNKHKIDDSELQKDINKNIPAAIELVKALRTSHACYKLQEEIKISEEKGVLVVPLRDGPMPAIYIMEKSYKSGKTGRHFDEIIPFYIDSENDSSRAQIICSPSLKDIKMKKNTLPISACYEGESGEVLLNCVEKINQISLSARQLAINVRIRESRFSEIQRTLDRFNIDAEIEYGYIENSQMILDIDTGKCFPKGWEFIDKKHVQDAKIKIFDL